MTIGNEDEFEQLKRVGDLAVQYEHTLVATRRGPVVVTLAAA
ncbi:MAG TPA: hypothetical protein VN694_13290 [Caulobacteraceae bacterium]|nr:hypothetical protein [Caulobacteraceae bacterium]